MSAGARKFPRPECPTGEQLVEELRAHADATGIPFYTLIRQLGGCGQQPINWINQTRISKCPRPRTVERVRAIIDGKDVPPPEKRKRIRPVSDAPRRGHVRRGRPREPQPRGGNVKVYDPRPHGLREEIAAHAAHRERQFRQAGRLSGTVLNALDRPLTEHERLAAPSDLIRFAQEEWPEIAGEVKAYAAETQRSYADAWLSVITAGLQCLREGD